MKPPASPLARLAEEPQRFGFDAAIRVLLHAGRTVDPGDIVRFRTGSSLAYPPSDVLELRAREEGVPPDLAVSVMGLVGPSGVLPRAYTETTNAALRSRSRALHDFLDLLAHRLLALFARSGTKYRPSRIAETADLTSAPSDPLRDALLALTGYATGGLTDRLAAGTAPLLHYGGLFAAHPRSADRLQAMVSDWLGRPVEVRQFKGAWLALPPDQRTRLGALGFPGQFDRLGEDGAIGVRAWDVQAGIVLRIGPLDRRDFAALLPDGRTLGALVSLVRAYLGFVTGFAVNLVVQAPQVPPLQLRRDADPAPRLGWNTWLDAPPGARRHDADDARFEAEVVEAATEARQAAA